MTASIEGRTAAILLWIVGFGWGVLPAPWLAWWVVARGRLPVLPLIGEPNGGPFYKRLPRATFAKLLAGSFVLGLAQAWVGWLLWSGERSGALLQFGLLPFEALLWYGFELPIPPILAIARVVLVVLAWPGLA